MNIKGKIISVTLFGDALRVNVRSKIGRASYAPTHVMELYVPAINERAYTVGREITVKLDLK
jgi:hypothetical protein